MLCILGKDKGGQSPWAARGSRMQNDSSSGHALPASGIGGNGV